jgi:ATP-dependent DNA helicase RecG
MRRAREFFEGLEVTIDLLSASLSAPERREVLERLADGTTDLVVGTHALFQDDIHFEELGFVIVDEQHKFGVAQRETLLAKGRDPHLLAMTATPIPRSLAHAVFGDLDLSVIREKPPGRQPVRTEVRPRSRARRVYEYVRDRIDDSGEQAYFVYPMIEANEESARRSVIEEAEKLREEVFADLRVEVLHGRLDGDTKDEVMQRFASGDIDVLCATTVIEVGVDVPNATLMVIENPEVFGLSQLHQLRGRIGRGAASSMCVLLASPRLTQEARERLIAFGQIDDGFELAEIDMKIRGPGLFLGLRQAGAAEFRFGDLIRDADWLETARRDVRRELLGDIGPPPG